MFLVYRLARPERFRRRVSDLARAHLASAPRWTAVATTGRYSRRGLHALDVSPGDLWAVDPCGKSEAQRSKRPRAADSRADCTSDRLHGHLSPAVLEPHRAGGGA